MTNTFNDLTDVSYDGRCLNIVIDVETVPAAIASESLNSLIGHLDRTMRSLALDQRIPFEECTHYLRLLRKVRSMQNEVYVEPF